MHAAYGTELLLCDSLNCLAQISTLEDFIPELGNEILVIDKQLGEARTEVVKCLSAIAGESRIWLASIVVGHVTTDNFEVKE